MGEEGIASDVKNTGSKTNPKLTLLPLIALIFYEVSGGPFGVEDSVSAGGGPLLSLLGFLIFPLLWSIPEALVTAELATSFPENGGYVIWISAAFGPFWGFQEGFWKWFSGVMDNALYPASTLAGEVEDPSRTFPKALLGAVVLVVSSYIIPLLAGTGALRSASSEWRDGYFAEVGMLIGGFWLKWWIQAAAAMSNMGLFEAEMSSDAFQLLGMSEIGMLPAIFASRSKYGTPTISILCSATGVIFLSWMSFQEIVEFLNFLYSIGMLLEFAAFIKLRIKKPDLHRPYKVPLQTFGVIMLCLPPSLLLVLVMCLASIRTFLVSGVVIVLGFFLYPTVVHAKDRKWARFVTEQPAVPSDNILEAHPIMSQLHQEAADEASVSLIPNLSSTKAEQESELLLEEALKME
ncbi:putative polyamine transporter [Vitis vinifera]|uniref:Putative polyamine transporter n=1 Tax=Vitis vinifera TaxID=29760 RepID=A0A438H697_VITVI|nr:putative polyamine transporter [Vitis vinifera]